MSSRKLLTQAELEVELENLSDFSDEFERFDDDIGDAHHDTESNSSDSSDGNDEKAEIENTEPLSSRNGATKGKSRIGHKLSELGKDHHGRTIRKSCHGCYETLRNGGLSSKDAAKSTKKVNTVCKVCVQAYCIGCFNEAH
ncbi:hypothetical protein JTB14_005405 [Gonioctena quinquepunctata]|nr:hypothetical protein JTB14_005405 [Gonioctena quinquepunctata]